MRSGACGGGVSRGCLWRAAFAVTMTVQRVRDFPCRPVFADCCPSSQIAERSERYPLAPAGLHGGRGDLARRRPRGRRSWRALPHWLATSPFLHDGGGTGARTLPGAVASSTIGVAGTVFSIAALSLAAGQMGPPPDTAERRRQHGGAGASVGRSDQCGRLRARPMPSDRLAAACRPGAQRRGTGCHDAGGCRGRPVALSPARAVQ
jgi:hypothetical protein